MSDTEAWKLALQYKDLVCRLTNQYIPTQFREDAIHNGLLHLYERAKTYDPTRSKFITHGYWGLPDAILQVQDGVVRVPLSSRRIGKRVEVSGLNDYEVYARTPSPKLIEDPLSELELLLARGGFRLSNLDREVLRLRLHGENMPTIAAWLGKTFNEILHRRDMLYIRLRKTAEQFGVELNDFYKEHNHAGIPVS